MIRININNSAEVLEPNDTLAAVQMKVYRDSDLETEIATETVTTSNTSVIIFDYTPPQEPCSIKIRLITSIGGYQEWTPLTKLIDNDSNESNIVHTSPVVEHVSFRGEEDGLTSTNNLINVKSNCPVCVVILVNVSTGTKSAFEIPTGESVLPVVLLPNSVYSVTVYGKLDGIQSEPFISYIRTLQDEVMDYKIIGVTSDKISVSRPLGTQSIGINIYKGLQHKQFIVNAGGSVTLSPQINDIEYWSVKVTYTLSDGSKISISKY